MRRLREAWQGAVLLTRAGVLTVAHSWGLAAMSFVAAFAVWFVVQDIEDPRVRAVVPGDANQYIRVEAVNLPDDYIVLNEPQPVRVEVEARQSDIEDLQGSDFRATVDVRQLFAGGSSPIEGELASLPVSVESRRNGVRVLSVVPPTVQVSVVRAETKEIAVSPRPIGSLPEGFRLADEARVEPQFVTVKGLPELVRSVAVVEADIALSGVKDDTAVFDVELVARTAAGNAVTVTVTPRRARVTLKVQEVFTVQSLPVLATTTGTPAPGYYVAGLTVEPQVVTVSGLRTVVGGLNTLTAERVDVTGARDSFTVTKAIQVPQNVVLDRPNVVVRVEVKPVTCGGTGAGENVCGQMTLIVGPVFEGLPAGLRLEGGPYTSQVRVSGAFDRLAALKPGDVKVTVSLAGTAAGQVTVPVIATAPSGIRIESAEPITVRLEPITP